MDVIVVSNNPMVLEKYSQTYSVKYFDVSYKEILDKVKRLCEEGHKLLSHPLSGSVNPKETPYKSVLMSKNKGEIDIDSLKIIINSLDSYEKFDKIKLHSTNADKDFQVVDLSLITSALDSANIGNV